MCLLCVEYQNGRLTLKEARRNLGEMQANIGEAHTREVEALLSKDEVCPPSSTIGLQCLPEIEQVVVGGVLPSPTTTFVSEKALTYSFTYPFSASDAP